MKKKIFIPLLLIMIISIVNNYFAKNYLDIYSNYYLKELIFFSIGFILIIVINKLNIDYILDKSLYLYLFGNILLVYTLIFGSDINGAKCWINIFGFSIQPSEFMKIFLILYLRNITFNNNLKDFKYILITFIIILIPSILTFLEPDTGQVIFYFLIWFIFLFLKKINKWYFIIFFSSILIGGVSFFILYYNYQDLFIDIFGTSFFYRMDRVTNFLNSEGYQIETALTSISNSGLFGVREAIYFPEAATDFALTLLIANFGLVGLILFLLVYFFLLRGVLDIKSDKYIKLSIFYLLLFQSLINIFMNVGLFPIIGITLPFLSYGGSSIISYMILIGIMINKKLVN